MFSTFLSSDACQMGKKLATTIAAGPVIANAVIALAVFLSKLGDDGVYHTIMAMIKIWGFEDTTLVRVEAGAPRGKGRLTSQYMQRRPLANSWQLVGLSVAIVDVVWRYVLIWF